MKQKLMIILSLFALTYVVSDTTYEEKNVSAYVKEGKNYVCLGGQTVGIKLYAKGVICVGFEDGEKSPAYKAGLREGDIILEADGMEIKSSQELGKIIENSKEELTVVFDRDGEQKEIVIAPQPDTLGKKRLGVWVRDSVGGVGTITCYVPDTGEVIALGHSVSDSDTGRSFIVDKGYITDCEIVSVEKSIAGNPGEIAGRFRDDEKVYAYITENTNAGIFGNDSGYKEWGKKCYIAASKEVKDGKALLITDLAGGEVEPYDVEIKKIYGTPVGDMIVEITDGKLLDITGGIVQGMSGSPIIQNGKIVGAVTHVFVNDPTRGYGIFIENMLEEANKIK